MQVFVLTIGNSQAGSTKYRIKQFEPYLNEQGIDLEYVDQHDLEWRHLEKMAKADLVINQKCLLSLSWAKKIRRVSRKLIFDFDDAIYTRPGKPFSFITRLRVMSRLKYWFRKSDSVIAANQHLSQFALHYRSNVEILPMTLDLGLWKPVFKKPSDEIVMGWAGAPVNLHHLEKLEPVLSSLLESYPKLSLRVYSGKKPGLSCRYEYIPFQEGTEAAFIQGLDIGLLPLSDEEFSKENLLSKPFNI